MVHSKRLSTLLLIVALLLSACQPIRPEAPTEQTPTAKLDEATITAIEALVTKTMSEVGIPGLALGIVMDGKIAYTKGFGVERVGSDKPVTPHTIFAAGSIGKTAVATAIMQLVEAGKIDLDKPVTDYLPYFKLADERYKEITVYQLITHRSGLLEVVDWFPLPVEYDDGALERYIRTLDKTELLFAPGEQFAYSGIGFILLADIIAKTSGQTFEAYLQENIIDPLGMADTLLMIQEADQATVAAPHVRDDAGKVVITDRFPYRRQFAPTGVLYSSIIDMARYSAAHLQRGELEGTRILPASAYDAMWDTISITGWEEFVPPILKPIQSKFGMGWAVGEVDGHFIADHVGADEGYLAAMVLAPDDKIAVVINSNYFDDIESNISVWEITAEIMGRLLTNQAPTTSAPIVYYASAKGMDNIDPAIGENYSVNNALISLYDALFIVRGDKRENHLVENYEAAPDASAFTFKLKQNAKFHDGSPVNAAAVVYSWQRMLRLQGPPTYRWTGVADENAISQVDEFTVKFTLNHPFAPFLDTLAHFYIVNPAIVEANKGDDEGQSYLATHAAGSGPFTQGRWEDKKVYEFIAVADYWGGWPDDTPIGGFQWIYEPDPVAQLEGLLAAKFHIAEVDIAGADKVRATPGWHVEDDLPFAINSIKLNTQGKYMSDLNLRKAVAYALNYAELPKRTNPPVTIATGPTPLNFPGAPADLETPTYDLAKAKSYLQQSAWPQGGITLDYAYIPALINEEITGQLLRDGLQQLNITLNLLPVEWDAMGASCTSPETGYELINIYTLPAYFDPDAHLYNQYHSSQWGSYTACSFYKNEAVDKLLDEARATAGPDKRQALYEEANRLIVADQPAIWTFTDVQFVAANDCIQNFRSSKPDNVIVLFQELTMAGCE
jgi:peptide/nickel transport system substrate-binding protein